MKFPGLCFFFLLVILRLFWIASLFSELQKICLPKQIAIGEMIYRRVPIRLITKSVVCEL